MLAWLGATPDHQLNVCAVTIGEIQAGIELTREHHPRKAEEIEAWLEKLATAFNVLPVDADAFRVWARLMHRRPDHLYEDAMIAAVARIHGLTIATRNIKDFMDFGVATFNPFGYRAP